MAEVEPGYRIERILSATVDGPTLALVRAFAKYQEPDNFEIVNEYVCAKLAHAVGLPCPPGDFALDAQNNATAWISPLAFSESPPPVDPDDVRASDSELCAGILAFDTWILNLDRHDFNVIHGSKSGTWIIDHGQALFYRGPDPAGVLQSVRATSMSATHLFAGLVEPDELIEWCERISRVDRQVIEFAIGPPRKMGLIGPDHAAALVDFLVYRSQKIRDLLPAGTVPATASSGLGVE